MAEGEKLASEATYTTHDRDVKFDLGACYQLVYLSTSLLPPLDSGGEREIAAILDVSREYNKRHDITGALIFNERHFAQVLEGARAKVGDLFRSIQRDRRHTDIVVLQEKWLVKRDFGAWAMAYVDNSQHLHSISSDFQLQDIILQRDTAGLALIEMMKYILQCPE